MAKARILAVVILGVLLLSALVPFTSLGSQPGQPVNLTPDNNTVDIVPTTSLTYEYVPDVDGHAQWGAWVQIAIDNQKQTDGSYTNLIFDSGPVEGDVVEVIPQGTLLPSTKYYWHVKVRDEYGYWSVWSVETCFTTVKGFAPDQPVNVSPVNGATNVSPKHIFMTTDYYDPDGYEVLYRQIQFTTVPGSYSPPLYDSGLLEGGSAWAYPVGLLEYGKTYYWRARYQDASGLYSAWSKETSFTVMANSPPNQPSNDEPVDGATGASVTPVLKASAFSDPNSTDVAGQADTLAASQWQIRSEAGTYASAVYDSGKVSGTATSITVPAGELAASTPYYWHVRYRDSYDDLDGNEEEHWSAYSEETLFTTKSMSAPTAGFTADKTEVIAGEEAVTFTDNSTPAGEVTNWYWNFDDGTTENWTLIDRPATGKVNHIFTDGGSYTVSLKVKNAAGENTAETDIVVHATPKAVFLAAPAAPKAGTEVTFADSSTGDITKWTWDFGDGGSEEWTKDTRPADGRIKHTFKKAGTYVATLTVSGTFEGKDVQHAKNVQVEVSGSSGFHFSLWMVGAAVAVIVVIAGVLYLLRARKGK